MARFHIKRLLGEGGMGKVFLAETEGREFALKFLNPGLGQEALGFFRGEVQLLSRLSHPNLVKIYDFYSGSPELWEPSDASLPDDLKTAPFFSMDYLDGNALEAGLANEALVSLLAQIAQGLHYLHARNILHRDLKPSNIQILSSGQAKILDFNLSLLASGTGKKSLPMGTVPYMPPEAFRGDSLPQSDLFSLGVIFYQISSGRLPFAKPLSRIPAEGPVPLSTWRPDLPEFLVNLIHRLLEFSPARRPSSALAVLKYLNQHREEPIPVLEPGATEAVLEKTPMVGREQEWKRAMALAAEAERTQRPVLLVLKGPAGSGRTRFLDELKWEFQLQGRAFVSVSPDSSPPWLAKLEEAFGLPRTVEEEDLITRLRSFFQRVPRESAVLAFSDLPNWRAKDLQAFQLFLNFAAKRELPWLLVLEGKVEPDEKLEWLALGEGFPRQETLAFPDLGEESAAALIALANPGIDIDAGRVREMIRRAGGRPLFLLEELRLALEESRSVAAADATAARPRPFQEFAVERLGKLSPEAQQLLALVIAHPVAASATQAENLWHDEPTDLQKAILELDKKGLLARRDPSEPRLRLAHPSLGESFSRALPEMLTRTAHRRWLELLAAELSAKDPEAVLTLAEHAWGTGEPTLIKTWGLKAAEILQETGPASAAYRWLLRLKPLAAIPEERWVLNAYLAVTEFRLGRYDEALAAYDQWLAERIDDETHLQKLKHRYFTGFILFTAERDAAARERFEDGLGVGDARHPGHRPFLARTHSTLAALQEKEWRIPEARAHLETAATLAQGHPLLSGEIEQLLGNLEHKVLNMEKARAHFAASRNFYRQAKNPLAEAIAEHHLGMLDRDLGELDSAERALENARRLALEGGEILQWARDTENLALIFMDRADYGKARALMDDAEAALASGAKSEDRLRMDIHRATLAFLSGNWERGGKMLERLVEPGRNPELAFYCLHLKAEAAYLQRRYDEALAAFENSLGMGDPFRQGLPSLLAELGCHRCEARKNSVTEVGETIARLEALPCPQFRIWARFLRFLISPTSQLKPEDISALLAELWQHPKPEVRIEILELMIIDLRRRELSGPIEGLGKKKKEELEKIFQELPEESKIDFERNRIAPAASG